MILQRTRLAFRNDPATHRNACPRNGARVSRNQRMPPWQGLALGAQPVGASGWKPVRFPHHVRGEADAIRHARMATNIVTATDRYRIKQATGDSGKGQGTVVWVAQLVQATAPTAVAEEIPFLGRERLQRFGVPPGCGVVAHANYSVLKRMSAARRLSAPGLCASIVSTICSALTGRP